MMEKGSGRGVEVVYIAGERGASRMFLSDVTAKHPAGAFPSVANRIEARTNGTSTSCSMRFRLAAGRMHVTLQQWSKSCDAARHHDDDRRFTWQSVLFAHHLVASRSRSPPIE